MENKDVQAEIKKNTAEEIEPMLPGAHGQSQTDQSAHDAVSAQLFPERQALISSLTSLEEIEDYIASPDAHLSMDELKQLKLWVCWKFEDKLDKSTGEVKKTKVPDTHEAIIPLDTYNKLQAEIARRRELGALANPHIPTSCFTSKLKCSNCGMSYRRHSYKRQNDAFAVWTCRGKESKGVAFCPSKNLPEPALFEASCSVLGLSEFDEDVFSEQVDFITVCPENVLVFHLTDGREISYTYKFKSTAKVDCWTQERRDEWGKMHLGQNNNKVKNPFTGFLRCPVCGGSFRRQSKTYADGTDATYWHCGHDSTCGNKCKVPETFLKQMICEVLDIPEFDENIFKEQILRIEPSGNPERQAVFHLADGRTVTKEWVKPKKRSVKHTQEWKDHMSEVMKEVKSHGKE